MRTMIDVDQPPIWDLHNVPGLPPFATVTFREHGATVQVTFWDPVHLARLSVAADRARIALARAITEPAPTEEDLP